MFTVGIQSPDFTPDDLEKIADETGGTYAAATSPDALTKIYDELGFQLANEYLLRYRSTAQPDQNVDVQIAVVGTEPVSFSYQSPSTGTAAPYKPAFRDQLLPVVAPDPAHRRARPRARASSSCGRSWSLRSNKALVARLGDFVTLPAEEHATERRKEVDALLLAVGQQRQRRRNWRWLEGFSEDVDVAQIEHDPSRMVWFSVLAGLLLAVVAGVLFSPFWVAPRDRAAARAQPRRPRQGAQGPERLRRAASREPRRARVGAPRRAQPRGRDGCGRGRGTGAVEA